MSDLQEEFGRALGEVSRTWRGKVNERLKPLGLSQAKWTALIGLARHPGGMVQSELAQRLGIEGPTLVRLLDRLEADGLVERRSSAEDRRCKLVVLSGNARPLMKKVGKTVQQLRSEILSGMSEKELAGGLKLMRMLQSRLDASS